jgi:hypothetical protein
MGLSLRRVPATVARSSRAKKGQCAEFVALGRRGLATRRTCVPATTTPEPIRSGRRLWRMPNAELPFLILAVLVWIVALGTLLPER